MVAPTARVSAVCDQFGIPPRVPGIRSARVYYSPTDSTKITVVPAESETAEDYFGVCYSGRTLQHPDIAMLPERMWPHILAFYRLEVSSDCASAGCTRGGAECCRLEPRFPLGSIKWSGKSLPGHVVCYLLFFITSWDVLYNVCLALRFHVWTIILRSLVGGNRRLLRQLYLDVDYAVDTFSATIGGDLYDPRAVEGGEALGPPEHAKLMAKVKKRLYRLIVQPVAGDDSDCALPRWGPRYDLYNVHISERRRSSISLKQLFISSPIAYAHLLGVGSIADAVCLEPVLGLHSTEYHCGLQGIVNRFDHLLVFGYGHRFGVTWNILVETGSRVAHGDADHHLDYYRPGGSPVLYNREWTRLTVSESVPSALYAVDRDVSARKQYEYIVLALMPGMVHSVIGTRFVNGSDDSDTPDTLPLYADDSDTPDGLPVGVAVTKWFEGVGPVVPSGGTLEMELDVCHKCPLREKGKKCRCHRSFRMTLDCFHLLDPEVRVLSVVYQYRFVVMPVSLRVGRVATCWTRFDRLSPGMQSMVWGKLSSDPSECPSLVTVHVKPRFVVIRRRLKRHDPYFCVGFGDDTPFRSEKERATPTALRLDGVSLSFCVPAPLPLYFGYNVFGNEKQFEGESRCYGHQRAARPLDDKDSGLRPAIRDGLGSLSVDCVTRYFRHFCASAYGLNLQPILHCDWAHFDGNISMTRSSLVLRGFAIRGYLEAGGGCTVTSYGSHIEQFVGREEDEVCRSGTRRSGSRMWSAVYLLPLPIMSVHEGVGAPFTANAYHRPVLPVIRCSCTKGGDPDLQGRCVDICIRCSGVRHCLCSGGPRCSEYTVHSDPLRCGDCGLYPRDILSSYRKVADQIPSVLGGRGSLGNLLDLPRHQRLGDLVHCSGEILHIVESCAVIPRLRFQFESVGTVYRNAMLAVNVSDHRHRPRTNLAHSMHLRRRDERMRYRRAHSPMMPSDVSQRSFLRVQECQFTNILQHCIAGDRDPCMKVRGFLREDAAVMTASVGGGPGYLLSDNRTDGVSLAVIDTHDFLGNRVLSRSLCYHPGDFAAGVVSCCPIYKVHTDPRHPFTPWGFPFLGPEEFVDGYAFYYKYPDGRWMVFGDRHTVTTRPSKVIRRPRDLPLSDRGRELLRDDKFLLPLRHIQQWDHVPFQPTQPPAFEFSLPFLDSPVWHIWCFPMLGGPVSFGLQLCEEMMTEVACWEKMDRVFSTSMFVRALAWYRFPLDWPEIHEELVAIHRRLLRVQVFFDQQLTQEPLLFLPRIVRFSDVRVSVLQLRELFYRLHDLPFFQVDVVRPRGISEYLRDHRHLYWSSGDSGGSDDDGAAVTSGCESDELEIHDHGAVSYYSDLRKSLGVPSGNHLGIWRFDDRTWMYGSRPADWRARKRSRIRPAPRSRSSLSSKWRSSDWIMIGGKAWRSLFGFDSVSVVGRIRHSSPISLVDTPVFMRCRPSGVYRQAEAVDRSRRFLDVVGLGHRSMTVVRWSSFDGLPLMDVIHRLSTVRRSMYLVCRWPLALSWSIMPWSLWQSLWSVDVLPRLPVWSPTSLSDQSRLLARPVFDALQQGSLRLALCLSYWVSYIEAGRELMVEGPFTDRDVVQAMLEEADSWNAMKIIFRNRDVVHAILEAYSRWNRPPVLSEIERLLLTAHGRKGLLELALDLLLSGSDLSLDLDAMEVRYGDLGVEEQYSELWTQYVRVYEGALCGDVPLPSHSRFSDRLSVVRHFISGLDFSRIHLRDGVEFADRNGVDGDVGFLRSQEWESIGIDSPLGKAVESVVLTGGDPAAVKLVIQFMLGLPPAHRLQCGGVQEVAAAIYSLFCKGEILLVREWVDDEGTVVRVEVADCS